MPDCKHDLTPALWVCAKCGVSDWTNESPEWQAAAQERDATRDALAQELDFGVQRANAHAALAARLREAEALLRELMEWPGSTAVHAEVRAFLIGGANDA